MDDPSSTQQPERGIALGAILASAGIHKNSVIRVTGQAGLAALLWFSRHGYRQVGYVRPVAHLAGDGDLLLVPQTCGLPALEDLLNRGPNVRPGGVLIVQTPETPAGARIDPVHQLLVRHGYDVERCIHGRRRELHVARRRPPTLAAAA